MVAFDVSGEGYGFSYETQLLASVSGGGEAILPGSMTLGQNYPNPFNPSTVIAFDLSRPTRAVVTIYNLLGQEVVRLTDRAYPAGTHRVSWNGMTSGGVPASSGIYLCRLSTADGSQTRKMLLLR
jgi:hypothetical protein